MEFLKTIGKAVGEAAEFLGQKSRKAAYLNRIRTVIRCEENAADKEYLALGRYYYNNLRDAGNPVTEPHCAELEAIEARLDKALSQLEKFYTEGSPDFCTDDETCEEVDLEDVESYDSDPMPEEAIAEAPVEEPAETPAEEPAPAAAAPAAEPEEDDGLPFEG